MTDLEKIIAEHADVTTDERGRKSYEFDDHGLRAFLAALAGAEPVAFPRVETGVIQFGDDWPGVFIRGDNAAAMAGYLRSDDPVWRNSGIKSLVDLLESSNVANKPSARVIPTHAPAKAREVTDADVLSALRAHIDRWPSQAAFAKHHSVSPQYVSDVLAGRRYIPEGWVSVIGYRKAGWVQDKSAALATFAEGE